MRLVFLVFLFIFSQAHSASADTCALYYQDYNEMGFLRWLFSSSDYETTYRFLSDEQNVQVLNDKGYRLIPKKTFLYDDLTSFFSMEGEKSLAFRVNSSGIITLSKVVKDEDLTTNRLFKYEFKSIEDVPQCGGVDESISKLKHLRNLYIQAYNKFQENSFGETIIYLESISKIKKGQSVSTSRALRNYEQILMQSRAHLNSLERDLGATEKIFEVRSFLLSGPLIKYRRSQTSIIDALSGAGANCVGNSTLLMAVLTDLDVYPDEGFQYGIEIFSDHVQLVLINDEHSVNWNILANQVDDVFETPILKLKSHIRDALITTRVSLYPEEESLYKLEPITPLDFLYYPESNSTSSTLSIDGVGQGGILTDYNPDELASRIDIFNQNIAGVSLARFTEEAVPEEADFSHLVDQPLLSNSPSIKTLFEKKGLKISGSPSENGEHDGYNTRLSLEDIGPSMYDSEAIRIYSESARNGRYTPEAISKYGFQHIAKYFPENSFVQKFAFKYVLLPMHLLEVDRASLFSMSGTTKIEWSLLGDDFVQAKYLPSIERYHFYFQRIFGSMKNFKNHKIPAFIELLKSQPSLKDISVLNREISLYLNSLNSHLGGLILLPGLEDFVKPLEFIEHNIPGFKNSLENLYSEMNIYRSNKLKDMHKLILEINDADVLIKHPGKLYTLSQKYFPLDVDLKNESRELYFLAFKFLLRNPDVFYTTEWSEFERQQNVFSSSDTSPFTQTIEFKNYKSELQESATRVNLPKVQGFSPCYNEEGLQRAGTYICSVSSIENSQSPNKTIQRDVVELSPHVLPLLTLSYGYKLSPLDLLFFTLSWTTANLNYIKEDGAKLFEHRNVFSAIGLLISNKLMPLLSSGGDIKVSLSEINFLDSNCENETATLVYRNCLYELSKTKFRNLDFSRPQWLSARGYLRPIADSFLNSLDSPKWDGYIGQEFLRVSYEYEYKEVESFNVSKSDLRSHLGDDSTAQEDRIVFDHLMYNFPEYAMALSGNSGFLYRHLALDPYSPESVGVIHMSFKIDNNFYIKERWGVRYGYPRFWSILPPRFDIVQLRNIFEKWEADYPFYSELEAGLL